MEKVAEELDFIDDDKHSGFFLCLILLFLFFLNFFNFYTPLSLKSKHTQNRLFKTAAVQYT